jgi:replicative DNA helicase
LPEFNTPIIALSHQSRNVENRLDQNFLIYVESGSIEQDADLVLMLYEINPILLHLLQVLQLTELIIAKQRKWTSIGTVKLKFNESKQRFLNFE